MPSSSYPSTIRVVPCDRAWRVIADPSRERMIDRLCTKERAVEHALELANELVRTGGRVCVLVEDRAHAAAEEIHVVH